MKFRIIIALINVLLVVALVAGGFTMAWFNSKASPPETATFITGNVDAEITGETVVPEDFLWVIDDDADCREFTWTLKNSGSKKIFLRAELEETVRPEETAWGKGKRFVDPGNWAMYFEYTVIVGGSTKIFDLIAGQDFDSPAGEVSVSNDGTYLYVTYQANDDYDWEMLEVHLAVADDLTLIPVAPNNGNPVPGRFPFEEKFDKPEATYTFSIPLSRIYPDGALEGMYYDWAAGDTLYIAAHAVLIGTEAVPTEGMIEWTQRDDCPDQWVEHGGFWYYCYEPLLPGEEVNLCLTGCPLQAGHYNVKIKADAVQAVPEAVAEYWGGDVPCLQAQ